LLTLFLDFSRRFFYVVFSGGSPAFRRVTCLKALPLAGGFKLHTPCGCRRRRYRILPKARRAGPLPAVEKTILALFHIERAFIDVSMFSRLK
jgi:hypothetical protein